MLNSKVMKNTLMLYTRQILLIFVSLYSIRVILNLLGVEDFGIYSVVAGTVTLCSFLTGSLRAATQRYFSFALGKKDTELLNKTFCVNIVVYIGVGVVVIFLLEVIGIWFIENKLTIPTERLSSAIFLYHFTVLAFCLGVITAPFTAIIIAHEDMQYFAIISVVEALMKLGILYFLVYIPGDKLELYGILLFVVSIVIAFGYATICSIKYNECQYKRFYWDAKLLKEIMQFTSWTLFGQLTTVARYQAITILLNQFFNPAVAASRAIAITVSTQVNTFSNNFNTGLYPAIIKNYAEKNFDDLYSLIYTGSKLTFFLMWVMVLPLVIEMEFVMTTWLGVVPVGAILFLKLTLLESLIYSVSLPLSTAARAPGKIKYYEITLGIMQLAIFCISYVFLELGFDAYVVFVVAVAINILMFIVRLQFVSKMINLSKVGFYKVVCLPIAYVMISAGPISFIFSNAMPSGPFFSIFNIVVILIINLTTIYLFGLSKLEKRQVLKFLQSKLTSRYCASK